MMLEGLAAAHMLETEHMASKHLRTSQIAKDLGVHVNTIRLYEEWGLLPEIPRAANGYPAIHRYAS